MVAGSRGDDVKKLVRVISENFLVILKINLLPKIKQTVDIFGDDVLKQQS
jgi:hypothetical protein